MPDKYGSGDRPSAIVVGGGPAGLTAAITLAGAGLATVLVGKRPARADNRTTALFAGSVTALETLGVWTLCAAQASPLKIMRIVDDTGSFVALMEILPHVQPGRGDEVQLTDALKHLLRNRPIYGYRFEGTRYDAGDKLGFLKATVEFALRRRDLGAPFREYLKGLKL